MAIELVTTDGIFALDGGEWEVTNNIWIVGDDRDVVVFDAAHDAQPNAVFLGPDIFLTNVIIEHLRSRFGKNHVFRNP